MVAIGIAGTGGMATQRVNCFRRMEGVEVAAVYSRCTERARALCPEARPFEDYEAMLDSVEAVALCLPNNLHAACALRALKSGRHALVEYPLCIAPGEMEALGSAAERSGCVLMVGNTIVHEAMFRWVVERSGRLGELLSAASRVGYFGSDIAGAWYMDPAQSGSPFVAYHYHHIEYYRRILGEVRWVHARDESRPDPRKPDFLSVSGGTLVMGHVGARTSCIQWYLSAGGRGSLPRGFWLNGTAGSLTIVSHEKDRSLAILDVGGERTSETLDDEWGVEGSCRDFIEAIRGNMDHRARLAEDMMTLRIGLAAAESARLDAPVTLD